MKKLILVANIVMFLTYSDDESSISMTNDTDWQEKGIKNILLFHANIVHSASVSNMNCAVPTEKTFTHELSQVTVAVEETVEQHLQGLTHSVVNCMQCALFIYRKYT